jgi:hypothetical protein
MDLRSLKSRIDRLFEEQGTPFGPPSAIFLLPGKDGHGPAAEEKLPLPRLAWRNAKAACILYDAEAGQPSAEAIDRLIEGAR